MKKFTQILSIAIFALAALTFSAGVQAQTASQEIQVSPARQNLEVSPGESISVDFKFYNLGDKTISGIIRASDFIVTDNAGTPQILDRADQVLPRFSGAAWVTLPFDRISIAAADQAPGRVTIKVPSDARPVGG